ncbi:MAG: hypothetical protein MHM6MM_001720 [Cercozoa sp. M6MM]
MLGYGDTDQGFGQLNFYEDTSAQQQQHVAPPPQMTSVQPPSFAAPSSDEDEFANEPPLLEELGINFGHISQRTLFALMPLKTPDDETLHDDDLAGPLVFAVALGFVLLLSGKLHFGYIFGFGLLGCLLLATLLKLLSDKDVEVQRTTSILGYCLLPILGLAVVDFFASFRHGGSIAFVVAFMFILWSTVTATRYIELVADMRSQRYLIAYPVLLLYSVFAIITVF